MPFIHSQPILSKANWWKIKKENRLNINLMKLLTRFSLLLAVASIASSAAAADTYLYITGSTAYRQHTHQAILNYLGSTDYNVPSSGSATATLPTGGVYGYSGSNWASAKAATFIIGTAGSRTIIKTSWSGAEAGIQAVTSPGTVSVKFLPMLLEAGSSQTGNPALTNAGASGQDDPTASGKAFEAHAADACMSDSYQSSSRFTAPTLTDCVCNGTNTSPVGLVPFFWVIGKGAPAGITNMDPNQAQGLYKGAGFTSAQMFSGNTADSAIRIYALGRDIDSGTRVIALAESGVGINSTIKQWRPNLPVGSSAVTAFAAVPTANTYDVTAGSNSVTVTGSMANIALGQTVVNATYFATGTIVASLVDATHFTVAKSDGTASTALVSAPGVSLTITANAGYKQTTGIQGALSKYYSQYPIQVINGVSSLLVGQGGESSGGNLVTALKANSIDAAGYGIAYLGLSDAVSAVVGGARALTYSGVQCWTSGSALSFATFDATNIKLGTYKFWGYEHLFYNDSTISADVKAIADGIGTKLFTTDAQIKIDGSVKVIRNTDGSPVATTATLP